MFINSISEIIKNNGNNSSVLSIPKTNNEISLFSGVLTLVTGRSIVDLVTKTEYGEDDKKEYDNIINENHLNPHPVDVFQVKPSETFIDENGYNCQKYLNPDGTYTIARTEQVGFFKKLSGVPQNKIIECYDADGNMTNKTDYPNCGNSNFYTVTAYNEDGSIKAERERFDTSGNNIKSLCDKTTIYNDDNTSTVSTLNWHDKISFYNLHATYYLSQDSYDNNGNKI